MVVVVHSHNSSIILALNFFSWSCNRLLVKRMMCHCHCSLRKRTVVDFLAENRI